MRSADAYARLVLCRFTAQRKRAAALMSLIQSTKPNGHDLYAYLKDVLARLPTQTHTNKK
jgi:hypothetical protein